MKVSTKGRYGLRALVDLAVNSTGEYISLTSIANRQELSVNYLEQVFSILRKAGLVNSTKGAQGGYTLAKTASDIKIGDILRILEGDLSILDDAKIKNYEETNLIRDCLKEVLWDKIDARVNEIVDNVSLEDMVFEYRKLIGKDMLMYNI